ncbi:hypothetical protein [Mesobacillus sp. S13]|uniref:hypothetical protein n=1 Tax=Mesobacillus sp. S13 TaxID=2880221 RepID=UPI001CF10CCE|nr:hypothetical protein [Mesobacillus sp. S13]
MNVTIKLMLSVNGIRIAKGGTFPLRRRQPEQVALDWIKEIKKEMNVEDVLEVFADGEDITEKFDRYQKTNW